ncbi:MAG: 3-keto-5-aminohexanoate cleavage protein [Chloroflexi bacterium]|nr:3-keto-5-aminohexanoate cleavage protein [Chloroflexota bacterium]
MVLETQREKFLNWITPIHLDPPDRTMDKKLVINVAPTGAFIKRVQNSNQPYTVEEVTRHVIESYKLGATMWHVHLRDSEGAPTTNAELTLKALDLVLDECPDMCFSHTGHVDHSKKGGAALASLVEPLLEAGKRRGRQYIHSVVIAPYNRSVGYVMDEPGVRDQVDYLQKRGIRAEFQIHHYMCTRHVQDWLLRDNLLEKPYVMNLIMGYHGYDYSAPVSPEPWGRLYYMSMLNTLPKESIVGATVGGHNWLPIVIEAIMLGADCVRIGMEDTIFMYPHKDERIKSCADVIRKVTTIACELGRDIATPEETRQILGFRS